MNDAVKKAQDDATKDFINSVGRALTGMLGDTDTVCELFTHEHNRQTAQAVLHLMARIDVLRGEVAQSTRRRLRQESGFFG